MHDAGDRRMRVIADRIGVLARLQLQLCGRGNELPGNRIIGIGTVNQLDQRGRDRDRIARGDALERRQRFGGCKMLGHELGRLAQCSCQIGLRHVSLVVSSAGGVHTTWSIRVAPLASMTSRSKPSATPLASGIAATAVRKSSSSG